MLDITGHEGNAHQNHSTPAHSTAFTQKIMTSVGKDVKKLEPSHPGENAKRCSYFGNQSGGSSKVKHELPYDPAIPLLGIRPREMKTDGHTKHAHGCSQHHYSQQSEVENTQMFIN